MQAGFSETLHAVRTPLALAALAFLLGAPILRAIVSRRSSPNADTRAIIRYGFGLGGLLAVLSTAATVYSATFAREIRISGMVRDAETSAGLGAVDVRVPGSASGATDSTGNFSFTIPDSRRADAYTLEAYRSGYALERVAVSGPIPSASGITIALRRARHPPSISLPQSLTVRHNLGVPQVEIALTYTNPNGDPVTLTDIGLTLVAPSGTAIPMNLEMMSVAPGQFGPALAMWKVEGNQAVTLLHSFFNIDPDFVNLQQRVFAEFTAKRLDRQTPNPNARLLSNALVRSLREYMRARFIWAPGIWQVRAHARAESAVVQAEAAFVLGDTELRRMRAISDYYQAGLGVFPNWRFWYSPEANPAATVLLSAK